MLLDDLLADRQTQTRSPVALGGEKDGKELLEGFGRHTRAGVGDADTKTLVAVSIDAEGNFALLLGAGIDGIGDEV